MNLEQLHKKLIGAARLQPPDTGVPYAFEQRILARLRRSPVVADPWFEWARSLWRASVPCIAVLVLMAGWSWHSGGLGSSLSHEPGFSAEDLELAVLDAVDTPEGAEEDL
ncbi:MAG TPA: hypothetical protein DCM86_09630 [Verrucomicrobiales bacterium]|nr:hypothetical protein [Verrucomicrobiales bacterium]